MGSFWLWCEWASSTFFGALHGDKYDKRWNSVLSEALDDTSIAISSDGRGYTVMIGGAEVWVANRFYSYGTCHCTWPMRSTGRPSVKTIIKLASRVDPIIREAADREDKDHTERLRSLVR